MNIDALTPVIAIVAAVSGIVLGWTGRSRSIRQDISYKARTDALQQADVEYIKRGVDDIRLEQKNQGKRIDDLSERVTRVEESAKQAHHRINRLDRSEI